MSLEKSSLPSVYAVDSVAARGTKGLINKSNESINIQTALRERRRKRERDSLTC